MKFFYDAQIRRKILHFGRLFGDIYISVGNDENGNMLIQRVPCRFADTTRQVEHIIRNNSENSVQSVPMMSYHIDTIDIARDKTQCNNSFLEHNIVEREYDTATNRYTSNRGAAYYIKRFNPINIPIKFKLNIWTSNLEHKLQIFEQLRMIFNPSIDIQESTNFLDITSLSSVELTDWNWSTKSFPIGNDDPIDVLEMSFTMNTFLTPPALVKPEKQIEQIVVNTGFGNCPDDMINWSLDKIVRSVHTPGDNFIRIEDNIITLLDGYGKTTTTTWDILLAKYGKHKDGITQLKLRILTNDIENSSNDVVGSISINPTDRTQLIWNIDVDTLPSATLNPVNAVIDPHQQFPDNFLPSATVGQRYLLVDDIPNNTAAWGNIEASVDDIIEYDGIKWNVVFDASEEIGNEVIIDLITAKRYMWNSQTGWSNLVEGVWRTGFWRLIFNIVVNN